MENKVSKSKQPMTEVQRTFATLPGMAREEGLGGLELEAEVTHAMK